MRPSYFTLVLIGLLAACGGGGESSIDELDDSIAVPPSPTSTEAPTATTESALESDDRESSDADPEAAVASWVELWMGAEMLATDPDEARSVIEGVASEQVFEQLDTILSLIHI